MSDDRGDVLRGSLDVPRSPPSGGRRGRPALATLACLAALLAPAATAGGDAPDPGDGHETPLRGAVVVLLDTVRPDRLSVYGHERPTSPSLERLAARGALFENAIAAAPWTLPSVAALLSAEDPRRALDLGGSRARLRRSLVEDLRAAGFATGAVTEGAFVSKSYGFDRGFSDWTEEEGAVQFVDASKPRDPDFTGSTARTFARARDWLRNRADGRFFLLVHTYEPHAPYTRRTFTEGLDPGVVGETFPIGMLASLQSGAIRFDDDDLRYLAALYDGGLREADREVGGLLDALDSLGLARDTLVVVTSDHGEELGEHDRARAGDHGHALHDGLLRIPLLVADPRDPTPRRIRAQVRGIDVFPTVLALLGVDPPAEVAGRSLVPLLEGRGEPERVAFGGSTRVGPPRAFVRRGGFKYIETTGPDLGREKLVPAPPPVQLYDLRADPGETRNLADARPELARELSQLLASHGSPQPEGDVRPAAGTLSEEQRERLRSLGYLE